MLIYHLLTFPGRNLSIGSFGQVAEDFVHQLGLGEDDHPGREEDEPGVRPDVHVFLVPQSHQLQTLWKPSKSRLLDE